MEEGKYCYKYPHPAVTTDCVVFGLEGKRLNILLIERGNEPYKGCWAFPGGFMNIDETAEEGARRELFEETGLKLEELKQFGTFTAVNRDPRERVITIAFYAVVRKSDVQGGDDASKAQWFPIEDIPPLAFDHDDILRKAIEQLKKDIHIEPIGIGNDRITPERITNLRPGEIFVFGSNLAGMHGGGAARIAVDRFGAIMGQGVGLQGQCYAIPTMQGGVNTIQPYVDEFIRFAKSHPEMTFLVTRIGCGIAGFRPEQIAPLFAAAVNLPNVHLPHDFWKELV